MLKSSNIWQILTSYWVPTNFFSVVIHSTFCFCMRKIWWLVFWNVMIWQNKWAISGANKSFTKQNKVYCNHIQKRYCTRNCFIFITQNTLELHQNDLEPFLISIYEHKKIRFWKRVLSICQTLPRTDQKIKCFISWSIWRLL